MRKLVLAGASALALLSTPLLAQDCTEEAAEAKSQELFAMIEADPSKAEKLDAYIAEVEAHFGGEPTPEQTCDAMDMLIEKVETGS